MSVEGVESALKDDLLKKYLKDALEVHEMGLDHKAEGWELFLKAETFAIWKRKVGFDCLVTLMLF